MNLRSGYLAPSWTYTNRPHPPALVLVDPDNYRPLSELHDQASRLNELYIEASEFRRGNISPGELQTCLWRQRVDGVAIYRPVVCLPEYDGFYHLRDDGRVTVIPIYDREIDSSDWAGFVVPAMQVLVPREKAIDIMQSMRYLAEDEPLTIYEPRVPEGLYEPVSVRVPPGLAGIRRSDLREPIASNARGRFSWKKDSELVVWLQWIASCAPLYLGPPPPTGPTLQGGTPTSVGAILRRERSPASLPAT